jgi:DNA-binding beta-propeller fold protein YncE
VFNNPGGIVFDGASTFYVADTLNNNIRAITAGMVSTLAGSVKGAIQGLGSADGTGSAALFNSPLALAIDATATYLYVADTNNATVRRVTIATGEVHTILGNAATPLLETAPGALPAAAVAQGVALDATHLYLATNDAVLVTLY